MAEIIELHRKHEARAAVVDKLRELAKVIESGEEEWSHLFIALGRSDGATASMIEVDYDMAGGVDGGYTALPLIELAKAKLLIDMQGRDD